MLIPTIVLGLGGVGSEIVFRLERMVAEKNLQNRAVFAVVDTDVNTMTRIRQEGFGGSIIQISQNLTVQEYLNNQPEYREWFFTTEGLNIKSMTEGAGQVRAISRLAFDTAVKRGDMSELGERLNHIFQISGEVSNQAPRILIVSSLAGGTGSGIVLPMALYMRKYFAEALHIHAVIVKGIFIMPDVLLDVIRNDLEQVSIEANAYAAIKELDAFIKKGEGYLPERYKDKLRLKMPTKLGTVEEYYTRPYDYCYLLGGKNKNGRLRNFQEYIDFAVNCIYAQSFSPMLKLNNSIEDNVYRIAATGVAGMGKDGFQRFCGAGISILTYPYKWIVQMLALKKAGKILSVQWLSIDKEYWKEARRVDELRRKGQYVEEQHRADFYIEYVDGNKESSPFVGKICQDTIQREIQNDGDERIIYSWEAYWEALKRDIEGWCAGNRKIEDLKKEIKKSIKALDTTCTKENLQTFQQQYRDLERGYTEDLGKKGSIIASRYFGQYMNDEDEANYMHWIKKQGIFIHPNSVRYFLYKVLKLFNEKQDDLRREIEQQYDFIMSCRREDIGNIVSKNSRFRIFWNRKNIAGIAGKLNRGLDTWKNYHVNKLLDEMIDKGKTFLENLSHAYEAFYDVFDYNVEQYMDRVEDIKRRFANTAGTVTRYVACDKKTLDYMENETIDIRNDVNVDGTVSKMIFQMLLNSTFDRDMPIDYRKLFQEDLIDYWENELHNHYGYVLDMDILEALERENLCNFERRDKQEVYALREINEMWEKASPLIEMNDKRIDVPKTFCTYSSLLKEKRGEVRKRVLEELDNRGGAVDYDGATDQYTILFYQVVYGLSPDKIKGMEIMYDMDKQQLVLGNISKSYYQMIENTRYSRMSPHIDWNWNRFDILPDFNLNYQEYLEILTYQMFIYQCVEHLRCNEESSLRYSLNVSDRLIQSNTLHDLLTDEFINNLAYVKECDAELKSHVNEYVSQGKTYKELPFWRLIADWKMSEWEEGGILWLIYCVNKDGGINQFDSMMAQNMVCAFLELLWRILLSFMMPEEAGKAVRKAAEREREKYGLCDSSKNTMIDAAILDALDSKLRKMGIE